MAHETCLLQTIMLQPIVGTMRRCNALLKRAKLNRVLCGLHYRFIEGSVRLVVFSDASHGSVISPYAFEGIVIGLTVDNFCVDDKGKTSELSARDARQFNGAFQIIYFASKKSKRISHSTSHAETLALINGSQVASLINERFFELEMS